MIDKYPKVTPTRVLSRRLFVVVLLSIVLLSILATSENILPTFETGNKNAQFAYLKPLIRKCGQLCRVQAGRFEEGLFFAQRIVPVNCKAVFGDKVFIIVGHGESLAPRTIPKTYYNEYTLGGEIPVRDQYHNDMYLTKTAKTPTWSKELVGEWIELAHKGQLEGNYGVSVTSHLKTALGYAPTVKDGRVLVIGSENPWVEAVVLAAGARTVVTLEYGRIESEHPAIETMTPDMFKRKFQKGTLGLFDAIVTFSSVEHSGLGRYGDALNPWGDVLEIARARCVCKTNGHLVIGVPTEHDAIIFNAHRVYGQIRWPYLASNWQQVHHQKSGWQQIFVFTNP